VFRVYPLTAYGFLALFMGFGIEVVLMFRVRSAA